MGTMPASDAAPLPRLGEVFFDVRGDSRTMRVSWYADTGVAVFSIWQGDTCTGTFRLPIPELPRMVEALTQGPPGRAGSGSRTGGPGLRSADPGPSTAAMGPGGMRVPVPGQPAGDYSPPYREHEEPPPDRGRSDPLSAGYPGSAAGGGYPDPPTGPGQDFPPQHGYGAPHAGYAATAPSGYQEGPPTGRYADTGAGGYQEGPPTGRYADTGPGGYQGPAPGGQHQRPADGYYQEPAPEGHHDLPPADYYQGSPPESHRDLPPGGHRDLPPGGGYGYMPTGAGYHAADDGYREPSAAASPGWPAQFAAPPQDPYRPTGPLPVGRWRTGEPGDEFPQARSEDGFGAGGYAEDRPSGDTFAADEFAPDGYAGEGFAQDGFAADGFTDDPLADSYQGEAEQGYLPSPPTDMFPAASLSDGYHGRGGHRADYEPDPADLDQESPYPAGRARRPGPPRDPGAYRPGRDGSREREYGPSRGRS
jgi:hypothetical protein